MNLKQHDCRGIRVVALSGAVDARSAGLLQAELISILRSGGRQVVVDLRDLEKVSGPILRVLASFAERFRPGCIALCVDPKAEKALAIAGLEGRFPLARREEKAVESLSGIQTVSLLTETVCRFLGVAGVTDVVEKVATKPQLAALATVFLANLAVPGRAQPRAQRLLDRETGPSVRPAVQRPLESER